MRLLPERLLPARLRGRRDRGSAEVGVALVAAAVVAGSLVGTGVARTAVEVTDGVTWLADPPTGQVVEINPATLEPQSSALVGQPGQQLVLSQDRGRLVVANRATGALTSIDLATLLASGRRDAAPGDAVSVLLDRGRAFLVDRENGLVASIDPVTLATRGRVFLAPKGLRDATVDGSGAIWVASGDDGVTRLSWSDASLTFTSEESRTLTQVGTAVRLVAHERGVTAVSPSTGAIVQLGTGHDLVSAAPQMRGPIRPAQSSSSSLVPVSVPDRDVVVLVRGNAGVSEVRTGRMGCPTPGAPVELRGVVYVPCPTTGRVIRLGGDGAKAGPDILTGEGTPELVVDDGALLVNVPGHTKGVRVTPDGTTTSFVRFDEKLRPADVDRDPREDDAKAEDKAREDRRDDRDRPRKDPPRYDPGAGGVPTTSPKGPRPTHTTTRTTAPAPSSGGGTDPSPSPSPSATPPAPEVPAPTAPVITDARAAGPSSASVTWTQPGSAASSYDVLVGGSVVATVSGSTSSTTLTGLATGAAVQVTVRGTYQGGRTAVSAAATVTPAGAPDAPTGVALSETARSRTSVTFAVSWDAAPDNGNAVSRYAVAASGSHGSDAWSGSTRSASVTLPCDAGQASCGSVSVSVTATNGMGTGPAGSATAAVSPTPGLPLPEAGAAVVASQSSEPADDEYDTDRLTTLTLAPPASWSGFTGVCAVRYTGATSGPGTVPCSATSIEVTSSRAAEMLRRSSHGVVLQAWDPAAPGTVVESAPFTWNLIWPITTCGSNGKICP